MGIIIIISIFITYAIATRYIIEPMLVSLIVLLLTTILFIIAFIITQSFERLADVSRMKSEFIGIISHHLRSPLTNLKWATDFLFSEQLEKINPQQLKYLKIIKENSDKMNELIQSLLFVAKVETENFFLRKNFFSLEEIIKNLINEFEPIAKATNIEIKFQTQSNLPQIFADSFQIKIAIENLLNNAIKYINSEKGQINIKLERRKNNLFFKIEDNGVGIPNEDQKYIFQKFFRSENALEHQTKGSGLGLYITKEIIVRSKGKIGFKSEENKGSTFWFTLPIK
jgi:signal transduction histidine kinase